VARNRVSVALAIVALFSLISLWTGPVHAQGPRVYVAEVTGTISSVTVEAVNEAIATASATSSPLILALDTPGGTLDATFSIIDSIERSSIPVIGYVTPAGARAWSAGTFILMSTHVAAMAPRTIIGSAQPVTVGPNGGATPVTDSKIINALTEFITVRAVAHGRNDTAAREFITANLNLDANKAEAFGVVEYVANDTQELLTLIDGRTVEAGGQPYTLTTANAELITISPSVRVLILRTLAEPVLASILLFIGLYWLIFGVSSPGHGSEVGGAVLLIAGLVGLGVLGVNLGGLVLIGVGAALLIAELYAPGFGALGIGGFIAVVLGSLLLFSTGPLIIAQPDLFLLFLVLITAPVAFGAFFLFAAYKVVEVRRRKPMGWSMIGELAEAVDDLEPGTEGFVIYQGELWKAIANTPVKRGEKVRITAKEGPVLRVSAGTADQRDIPATEKQFGPPSGSTIPR
jgi:membrane-bound serine protease (ClpP class)